MKKRKEKLLVLVQSTDSKRQYTMINHKTYLWPCLLWNSNRSLMDSPDKTRAVAMVARPSTSAPTRSWFFTESVMLGEACATYTRNDSFHTGFCGWNSISLVRATQATPISTVAYNLLCGRWCKHIFSCNFSTSCAIWIRRISLWLYSVYFFM